MAVINEQTTSSSYGSGPATHAYSFTPTAGNTIVIAVNSSSGDNITAITDDAGNTYEDINPASPSSTMHLWRADIDSVPTEFYTAYSGSALVYPNAIEVEGIYGNAVYDTGTGSSGFGTTHTISVDASAADDFIAVSSNRGGGDTQTFPGSITLVNLDDGIDQAGDGRRMLLWDAATDSAGTKTVGYNTGSGSSSNALNAVSIPGAAPEPALDQTTFRFYADDGWFP